MKLFPAAFPDTPRVSRTMNSSIPVYNADGNLYACVSEPQLARLQSAGLVARIVRHHKGQINRAILFTRPGEPKSRPTNSVMGTRYSFKEPLEHGSAWELKRLDGNRAGKTYAPPKTRAVFFQVLAECTNGEEPSGPRLGRASPGTIELLSERHAIRCSESL